MAEWSLKNLDSPINQPIYQSAAYPSSSQNNTMEPPPPPTSVPQCPLPSTSQAQPCTSQQSNMALQLQHCASSSVVPKGDNPRAIRNKAEKNRRDKMKQAVEELSRIVPPVVASPRKVDKTSVLRLTAHYLRAHQYAPPIPITQGIRDKVEEYKRTLCSSRDDGELHLVGYTSDDAVFDNSIEQPSKDFSTISMLKVLGLFNGFLITVTYKGIIVVVSQNVNQFLGYTELDLLGHNLINITHQDDRAMLREQLIPRTQNFGPNGELLIPDEPNAISNVEEALSGEKRRFMIRFKKQTQRSEQIRYVTCHVEGSFRKSDRACGSINQCCQSVRRVRARTVNPCSSGNDIVFVGVCRPTTETFINESTLEGYRMEYRTRHTIDGQIMQCESRIAMVTGYLMHEVSGMNAMNFMHRDDVGYVVMALREMYDHQRMYGESCYRLITKNGLFIYMRTRGRLDVDQRSRECTSFICTNTVVDEKEGKFFLKLMKDRFTLAVSTNDHLAIRNIDEENKDDDPNSVPVEDPRRLEKVILNMVTNLPSPPLNDSDEDSEHISIIPPNKENIVSAIARIYDVISDINLDPSFVEKKDDSQVENTEKLCVFDSEPSNTAEVNTIVEFDPQDPNMVYSFGENTNSNSTMALYGPELLNTEYLVTPSVLPDLGYFNNSVDEYAGISSIFGQNDNFTIKNNDSQELEFKCLDTDSQTNNLPIASCTEESDLTQLLSELNTTNVTIGMKRAGDFEDIDFLCKKKYTEASTEQNEASSVLETSTLEHFFDESFLNTEVDPEVASLDTLEPTFPDLMEDYNVQAILALLENDKKQEE